MSRPLKVYGSSLGMRHRIVATTTQKAAAKAARVSPYEFANYWSETGNERDIAVAMGKPGVVFSRSNRFPNEEYVEEPTP